LNLPDNKEGVAASNIESKTFWRNRRSYYQMHLSNEKYLPEMDQALITNNGLQYSTKKTPGKVKIIKKRNNVLWHYTVGEPLLL
jgi:hypothetical protein